MSIKKISFSGLALMALFLAVFAGTPAQAADKALLQEKAKEAAQPVTQAQVEQIVHDYILKHPKLIMDSVNKYRFDLASQQAEQNAQDAAQNVKKNVKSLTGNVSPVVGNPKGDVTVVEFFDFNCHYCKGAFPTVEALLQDDKNVRLVLKDFPILGPSSIEASKWALAAQKQGKYYPFFKALMLNREPITDDVLRSIAKQVGLDVAQAEKDAQDPSITKQIEQNEQLAEELGIHGTPSFVIGNKIAPGVMPEDQLEEAVQDVRAQKDGK